MKHPLLVLLFFFIFTLFAQNNTEQLPGICTLYNTKFKNSQFGIQGDVHIEMEYFR
jgi:hypothetical protein